jgi:CHAD domain-containing protein
VCNLDDKTVVRVTIEEPVVVVRGETNAPLASVVTVRPVLGYDRELERACSILERDLGLSAPAVPLVERAITVAGGDPGGVSSKVGVKLTSEMRCDEATVLLCRRLADIVDANLPGTLDDIDPEFLHDLRVAVRRTRSVLKEMKGVFPPEALDRAKTDLRWIQEVTGPTRDYDVQLEEWPGLLSDLPDEGVTDLQPRHELLMEHRAQAFRAMRRQLRSARFADAWTAWRAVLQGEFVGRDDADRPNAGRPVAELAGDRVARVYSHMVELGGAIDDDSPAELLHDLRKRGKELRYLLELFGQLWDADVVDPMVSALKTLQDVLGTFQDDSVQAGHLRSIAPGIGADSGRTDLLLALGVVLNQLARNQDEARRHFAERFESFSAPRIRKRVRRTFKPMKHTKRSAEAS